MFYNTYLYIFNEDKEYLCEEGSVIDEEVTEMLDSVSVNIKYIENTPLDLQPMDLVEYRIKNNADEIIFAKRMKINSWQWAITRQCNPIIYNYSITLISEIKEAEGKPLPNLVITNDKGLSVADYISRYNDLYGHYGYLPTYYLTSGQGTTQAVYTDDNDNFDNKSIALNSITGIVTGDTDICTYLINFDYSTKINKSITVDPTTGDVSDELGVLLTQTNTYDWENNFVHVVTATQEIISDTDYINKAIVFNENTGAVTGDTTFCTYLVTPNVTSTRTHWCYLNATTGAMQSRTDSGSYQNMMQDESNPLLWSDDYAHITTELQESTLSYDMSLSINAKTGVLTIPHDSDYNPIATVTKSQNGTIITSYTLTETSIISEEDLEQHPFENDMGIAYDGFLYAGYLDPDLGYVVWRKLTAYGTPVTGFYLATDGNYYYYNATGITLTLNNNIYYIGAVTWVSSYTFNTAGETRTLDQGSEYISEDELSAGATYISSIITNYEIDTVTWNSTASGLTLISYTDNSAIYSSQSTSSTLTLNNNIYYISAVTWVTTYNFSESDIRTLVSGSQTIAINKLSAGATYNSTVVANYKIISVVWNSVVDTYSFSEELSGSDLTAGADYTKIVYEISNIVWQTDFSDSSKLYTIYQGQGTLNARYGYTYNEYGYNSILWNNYGDYIILNGQGTAYAQFANATTLFYYLSNIQWNASYIKGGDPIFTSTKCPNMQWTAPTLREVLNDLCLVCDCLISIQNNVLVPVNISETKGEYTGEFTYINCSQSLEDYASEIHSQLDNAIDELDSKINNDIGFKNNDVAYFSTNLKNLKNGMPRPIIQVNKFIVNLRIFNTLFSTRYVNVDMSDYVKEIGVYQSLKSGRGIDSYENIYKKNCIYYTKGEKDIVGLTTETNEFLTDISVIEQWETIIIDKVKEQVGGVDFVIDETSSNDWRFEIEYISIGSQTYRLSRGTNYNLTRNNFVTIDNQNNSTINISKFTNFEKNKLSRLSNEILMLQQFNVENFNDIANNKQTYKNYIIYSRKIIVNRRNFDVIYYASKKYILQNYFTSLNSAKRNFLWIDNSQAVERSEFKKIYFVLSFNEPISTFNIKYLEYSNIKLSNILNDGNNELTLKLNAFSPFINAEKYINFMRDDSRTIKIETGNINNYVYNDLLSINGNLQCVNNQATYNFMLDDNAFAGFTSFWKNQDLNLDYPEAAFYNEGTNYNSDIEFNTFKYLFIKLGGHTYMDELQMKSSNVDAYYENIKTQSQTYPYNTHFSNTTLKQESDGLCLNFAFEIFKDNAEKLGLSFTFEWDSDNEDIVILNDISQNSLFYKNGVYEEKIIVRDNSRFYQQTSGAPYETTLIDTSPLANVIRIFQNNIIIGVNGLFFQNNNYYADYSCTTKVDAINLIITNGGAGVWTYFDSNFKSDYIFVYDKEKELMLLRKLENNGSGSTGYWLSFEEGTDIEISQFLNIFIAKDYGTGNLTQVYIDTFDFSTIHTLDKKLYLNSATLLSNENLINIKSFNAELVETSLTGIVNYVDSYLSFTIPETGSVKVVINNSIEIDNPYEHCDTNFLIKLYLTIKDFFV